MTFWWLIWRFSVLVFALWLISTIWWYMWLISYIWSESMISELKNPEIAQNISKITNFFSGSSYIKYTPSEWFITNKSGVIYQDGDFAIDINISWDANRWYDWTKKWLWITNKFIYINSNNGRNQVIPRNTIMKLFINTWQILWNSNIYIDNLFTGTNIISGDIIYIWSEDSAKFSENINQTLQNPNFYKIAKNDISNLFMIMAIPLFIALFVFIIFFILIYIFIFLVYIFVAWLIWYFMWSVDSFDKAVSISRIPFIIKEILQITFGLEFLIIFVIYIFVIFSIIYYQKNIKLPDLIEKSSK